MTSYLTREDILQGGVSSAIATLFAIEGGAMLQNLPADPADHAQHNHALHLIGMLSDHLHRIQAEIDAMDAAAAAKRRG